MLISRTCHGCATRLVRSAHRTACCDLSWFVNCRVSISLLQKGRVCRPCLRPARTSRALRCSTHQSNQSETQRYAIVGGGFAGVATAHYLAATASVARPVVVHLYDLAGLGSGGSGAAGGLLHPFSPKGKLLWKGQEAFETAIDLISVAELGAQQYAEQTETAAEQFVWRQDILRPAGDAKQAAGFGALKTNPVGKSASVHTLTAKEAHASLPGLDTKALPEPSTEDLEAGTAALLIKGGLVLHPYKYLRSMWQLCERRLAKLGNGSEACLRLQQVHSLAELEEQHGRYDAVVVAAGAAAAMLPEVGDVLPLRLCQGYGLELVPATTSDTDPTAINRPFLKATNAQQQEQTHAKSQRETSEQHFDQQAAPPDAKLGKRNEVLLGAVSWAGNFPAAAPSLVGATYMGVQGRQHISVGATKQFGLSPEQALQECGRQVTDAEEVQQAEQVLKPKAEALWSPAASWQVARVRTGVRALPQTTIDGAIPLAGRLPSTPQHSNWWIVGGLGARGLVYHAWLGKLVAQAIVDSSEASLPKQLLRWKLNTPSSRS